MRRVQLVHIKVCVMIASKFEPLNSTIHKFAFIHKILGFFSIRITLHFVNALLYEDSFTGFPVSACLTNHGGKSEEEKCSVARPLPPSRLQGYGGVLNESHLTCILLVFRVPRAQVGASGECVKLTDCLTLCVSAAHSCVHLYLYRQFKCCSLWII